MTSKMEQRGGQVIKVDRFFPSSKTCHCVRVEVGRRCNSLTACSSARTRTVPIINSSKIETRTHAQNILHEALRLIGLREVEVITRTTLLQTVHHECG